MTTKQPSNAKIVGYLVFNAAPKRRMQWVAQFPDGTAQIISRRNDGSYNTPEGTHASPMSYAFQKWREAGAFIKKRPMHGSEGKWSRNGIFLRNV